MRQNEKSETLGSLITKSTHPVSNRCAHRGCSSTEGSELCTILLKMRKRTAYLLNTNKLVSNFRNMSQIYRLHWPIFSASRTLSGVKTWPFNTADMHFSVFSICWSTTGFHYRLYIFCAALWRMKRQKFIHLYITAAVWSKGQCWTSCSVHSSYC